MNREDQSAYDASLRNNWLSRRQSLLLIGFILILISNMRGGAGVFAWFMPIPFLLYVALYRGAKERLWLLAVLLAGFIGVLAKTTSEPLMFSVAFAIMSGTVTGLRYFLAFLVWDYIRKWAGARIGVLAFPAVVVSLEYLQAFYSPLGDWGALANTQLYNLPLLQTAALFGFLGISALMAWAAVLAASLILEGSVAGARTPIALFIVVFVALNVYGDLRLDAVPRGKHVLAAAIANDYTFTGALPDPRDPAAARNTNTLIEKTREAARQGAAIAVWGEASTIVSESGEQQLLGTLSDVARSDHIAIVAAYVVTRPESGEEPGIAWRTSLPGYGTTAVSPRPTSNTTPCPAKAAFREPLRSSSSRRPTAIWRAPSAMITTSRRWRSPTRDWERVWSCSPVSIGGECSGDTRSWRVSGRSREGSPCSDPRTAQPLWGSIIAVRFSPRCPISATTTGNCSPICRSAERTRSIAASAMSSPTPPSSLCCSRCSSPDATILDRAGKSLEALA